MPQNKDIKKAYLHGMQNCPVCKEFYSENTKTNLIKMYNVLCGFCNSVEWKLILPSNLVFAGENYYEHLIDERHVATVHDGVEKTMQYLTDRDQSQSVSALVQPFVASCDTCQRVKQSNKSPLGLVIPLHATVRPCSHIWMDFLKLTPVFIKRSTMYPTIESIVTYILYPASSEYYYSQIDDPNIISIYYDAIALSNVVIFLLYSI